MAILEWTSSKLKVPANSPLNGESEAAMAAQGKIVHYRHMLQQIFGVNVPGEIVTDSKSLKDAVQSNNAVKDKRTSVNINILRSILIFLCGCCCEVINSRVYLLSVNHVHEGHHEKINKED